MTEVELVGCKALSVNGVKYEEDSTYLVDESTASLLLGRRNVYGMSMFRVVEDSGDEVPQEEPEPKPEPKPKAKAKTKRKVSASAKAGGRDTLEVPEPTGADNQSGDAGDDEEPSVTI